MTRTVGIDLAVTGPGVFTVVNAQYERIGGPTKFQQDLDGMKRMWEVCREGLEAEDDIAFIMEPTGHAWTRMMGFLRSVGETQLYAPSPRKFSALRKTLSLGVKNDGLDSLALARIPAVAKESLRCVEQLTTTEFALNRVMKLYGQITKDIVRTKTRLQAMMGLVNQGLVRALSNNEFTLVARRFIREVVDPRNVASIEKLKAVVGTSGGRPVSEKRLKQVLELCQANGRFLTQCEANRSLPLELRLVNLECTELLDHLEYLEKRQSKWVRERDHLVKELDPEAVLQSVVGIGAQIAGAIYGFSSPISRFANVRAYKGYIGLVPGSHQSGGNKKPRGTSITKAGPNPLKAAYYQAAKVAVLCDPELAAFGCRLQERGLKYSQVIVAVANKVMARAFAVMKRREQAEAEKLLAEDGSCSRAFGVGYELRSVEKKPISKAEAKEQIAQGYRLKSTRYPEPPRMRQPIATAEEQRQHSIEGATHISGVEIKAPPERSRQSSTPQPEATHKGTVEDIIASSKCPSGIKALLTLNIAKLQAPSGASLRAHLQTRDPDPELIELQLKLLVLREGAT